MKNTVIKRCDKLNSREKIRDNLVRIEEKVDNYTG